MNSSIFFMRRCLVFISAFLLYGLVSAQYLGSKVTESLKKHVYFLASDKLEGRLPGTAGEEEAARYISTQFKKAGVKPGGENGSWFKPFQFTDKVVADNSCTLSVNEKNYTLNSDFWPMAFSGNGTYSGSGVYVRYGITNPEKEYDDYKAFSDAELKGKVFIIELSSPDGIHPHSAHIKYSAPETKVKLALEKGASAVIFIDNRKDTETPSKSLSKNIQPENIPVVLAEGLLPKILSESVLEKIELNIKINRVTGKGKNVVGFIDNGAAQNVIIGAHYDHLGWGSEGSLYNGEPAIHNGADDNASGTAALIEIGKYLAKKGPKNNNYILVAFSAEEKGLLGSNDFVKSSLFDPAKANYMINMDMVGRLENDQIAVNAVGTSSMWGNNLNAVKAGNLKIKTSESGIGPSDHTSFYLKDIPVLHFFTGTHADYHKPSDDAEKINFEGMNRIGNFIIDLITALDGQGKLDFVKTKEAESTKAPRFSVTLGIVPDYMYDGQGVKADGVTDGKPAQAAGVKAGDVLIRLGDYTIHDMKSYMEALGKFKKGDSTELEVMRNGQTLILNVQF
ncbi:MAG: M28 family peptidase [Flavobacteriales bacterium]|nr:M28 family peptidase [Flavobacteriales bacterium]